MLSGRLSAKANPEVDPNMPYWFNPAGLDLKYEHNTNREIVFTSLSGAWLRLSLPNDPEIVNQWIVEWHVLHNPMEGVTGKLSFSRELLLTAFGLIDPIIPACGRDLVTRYKAKFAVQGRCILDGDYLNIPCPGTGLSGDPNLSVYLSEDIKDRVRSFVG